MKQQPEDSDPTRVSSSTRPPDYVIVVSASDWVKEHFPAAGASLWDACTPAKTVTATPNPNPIWKPNHDPHPK